MFTSPKMIDTLFRLSPRIKILPILHASGDLAQEVRETLIHHRFDCLALPLPPSVELAVEQAIDDLPHINVVVQPEPEDHGGPTINFVPVDPCQPVIMAIRGAMAEGIPRAYIDREAEVFHPAPFPSPEPYALKHVPLAAFCSALVPALIAPPRPGQQDDRITWMAFRLHELELDYESILCLCHVMDWPWLRQAYLQRRHYAEPDRITTRPSIYSVKGSSLYFILGELPFITQLYEQRRAALRSDRHVSVDGIKELLLETRTRWQLERQQDIQSLPNWVTPQLLQLFLQYVRNLSLMDGHLTPDLYTLVLAAKQMAGDQFAITLLETAKTYLFQQETEAQAQAVSAGIGKLEFSDGTVAQAKNRLQGPPLSWRSLSLRPHPTPRKSQQWALRWDPFRQCSWPPEDNRIESFTSHVREQARAILGADLARIEKFTTSFKDGVDLRESLRHWYSRSTTLARTTRAMDIYVKEIPPSRGNVEAVVFLFDTPADPSVYTWQTTWYAEHQEESTLCFYATPFQNHMVGPGIAQARYGGAFFLFPPRMIPNIWEDPRLASTHTLEERLIGAAALHSQEPHIVLVSPIRPLAPWRRITTRFNKKLVPIPLTRFSGQTVDRLRRFHVLNGHEIRSYADRFIR